MGRFLKAVLVLLLLGAAALVGYAYLGEASFTPEPSERRIPVPLDVD